MATLPESQGYVAGIYQLEITDPVEGGPNGIANTQAKQLASRTKWLKDYLDTNILPMLAPLTSGLGAIWWDGPIASIPNGWGENDNMRGRMPIGKTNSGGDSQFFTMSATGGSKNIALTAANMPKQSVNFPSIAGTDSNGGAVVTGTPTEAGASIGTTGNDSPQAVTTISPYRVGMWIKWVGIGNGING